MLGLPDDLMSFNYGDCFLIFAFVGVWCGQVWHALPKNLHNLQLIDFNEKTLTQSYTNLHIIDI